MKKEIFARFLVGLSIGEVIGLFVNIIMSLAVGNGEYIAVMPQLACHFKTEITAVIVQTVLLGVIGIAFAESVIVFTIDGWSFLKKCLAQFMITVVIYIPFVYLCYMPKNLKSIIIMAINFIFTYALTWYIQYQVNKNDVNSINKRIQEVRENECNRN